MIYIKAFFECQFAAAVEYKAFPNWTSDEAIEDTLEKMLYEVKVKGRIEIVPVSDRFTLMIDYAHNAMALKSILETLKEYNTTTDSANRTVATLMKIIKSFNVNDTTVEEDPLLNAINGSDDYE